MSVPVPGKRPPAVPFQDLRPATRLVEKSFASGLKALLRESAFSGGPYVASFEKAFAAYLGTPHCVAVNSGTSAVHLALLAAGVGPGDEVIVPAFTFVGSAWGILYCGAKPVFVDVLPGSGLIDPAAVGRAITRRTKAIIPVHLFGRPADMAALRRLCRSRGLFLIEDAAQAHGAQALGRRVGAIGDLGCFSFYPTKNLGGAGEGGAVVTADRKLAERMRALRNHAQSARYRHDEVGFNYRMDGMQGLFLEKKLAHLGRMNAARRKIAVAYLEGMGNQQVTPLAPSPDSVWHLFVVRARRRERFLRHLDARGIGHAVHYPVILPELPPFRAFAKGKRFPESAALAREVVSLPMFHGMTKGQIARVIDAVNSF